MNERYLPLRLMDGQELAKLVFQATTLDFDVEAIVPQRAEDLVAKFSEYCEPPPSTFTVKDRVARARHISGFISALKDFGFAVTAGSYNAHSYDVDDSDGSTPIIFAEWDSVVAVVRVSADDQPATRAYIDRTMDKYTSSSDPSIVADTPRGKEEAQMLFNVMVSGGDNIWEEGAYIWPRSRIFEYTQDEIKDRLGSLKEENLEELLSLPTLFMYEQSNEGLARVGSLKRIQQRSGAEIRVIYEFDESIPGIEADKIAGLKWELGLADFEFSRTHWAVKPGDLHQILRDAGLAPPVPAAATEALEQEVEERPSSVDVISSKVFLVHGRDDGRKHAVARFLERRVGLEVVILSERPNKGRAILTKFEEEADGASYAIVLMTPDDLGKLKPALVPEGEPQPTPQPRARQNVVFELGFFIGRLGANRVCALLPSGLEKPSDYDGIVYIHFDDNDGWQRKLVTELHAADVPVAQTWWES